MKKEYIEFGCVLLNTKRMPIKDTIYDNLYSECWHREYLGYAIQLRKCHLFLQPRGLSFKVKREKYDSFPIVSNHAINILFFVFRYCFCLDVIL